MIRPDQELLSLEVGAGEITGPDHGYAHSDGFRLVFHVRDETRAQVADREDAFVQVLLQKSTTD